MKKEFHAFEIPMLSLKKFLNEVQKGDDMRGNTVERVDLVGDIYVVLISCEYSYPFIINNLRDLEREFYEAIRNAPNY
jgi:hypothetical protein